MRHRSRVFIFVVGIVLTSCLNTLLVRGQDEDYTFGIEDFVLARGESGTAILTLINDGDDLEGFSFGVCHDGDALLLGDSDVEDGEDVDIFDVFFNSVAVLEDSSEAGFTVSLLMDPILPAVIAPGEYRDLYRATYTASDDFEEETELEFCETLGNPTTNVQVIVDSEEIEPVVESATVSVGDSAPLFLRGDVDGNGVVSPILDSLYALEFQFVTGESPPCMVAADVDGNGTVSALVDSLFLLEWGFLLSEDPPAPGTEECGPPRDEDALDCMVPPDCA